MRPAPGRLRERLCAAAASLLAVLAGCPRRPSPPPPEARALALRMQAGVAKAPGCAYPLPYRLFVPPGYDASRKYPLVLYLHGAGGWGTDGLRHLSGDVAALLSDRVQAIGPSFVLAPQCPPGDEWVNHRGQPPFSSYDQDRVPESDASKLTFVVLKRVCAEYPIDADRVYVTGPSMGGSGTWDLITRHPGTFAAAVPVTGVNDPSRARVIAELPIWAFHGSRDEVSPVQNTRAMVAALRALGSPVRFTEIPDAGHDSWTRAYSDLDMYRWLFAQRRPRSPAH